MSLTRALRPAERAYVEHALSTVKAQFGELDFSLESLRQMDLLTRAWAYRGASLSPEERGARLVTFVRLFAPYVAECIVRGQPNAGLVWGQGQLAVLLTRGRVRMTFFTGSRIAKALEGDVAVSDAVTLFLAAFDEIASNHQQR